MQGIFRHLTLVLQLQRAGTKTNDSLATNSDCQTAESESQKHLEGIVRGRNRCQK